MSLSIVSLLPLNGGAMEGIAQDVRLAVRSLFRTPLFSLVVVVSIAVGFGVSLLVLSASYRVQIRPLPYKQSEHLVRIMASVSTSCAESCPDGLSPSVAAALSRQTLRSLEAMALFAQTAVQLGRTDQGRMAATAAYVEPALFEILGIQATRGRTFAESDITPEPARVVLLSERLRDRLYPAVPNAIGMTVSIDGEPATVIGVIGTDGIPAYPEDTELWLPLTIDEISRFGGAAGIGRRWSSASLVELGAELELVAGRMRLAETLEGDRGLVAVPEEQWLRAGQRRVLGFLSAAVCLTFLVASINLANLSIVRAMGRRQAFFVRQAIGATRSRIARDLTVETMVLLTPGAAVGILLANWGGDAVQLLLDPVFQTVPSFHIDMHVLVALLVLSATIAVLVGLAPMLTFGRAELHASVRTVDGPESSRVQRAFVFAQVTATLILVAGAGILARSYVETQWVDLGLQDREALVVPLPNGSLAVPEDRPDLVGEEAAQRLLDLPFVESAASWTTSSMFLPHLRDVPLTLEDRGELLADYSEWPRPFPQLSIHATPAFFETLGLQLLRGRRFDVTDGPQNMPVAILNEAAAERLWPTEDAIGKRFKLGRRSSAYPWVTVVGVVSNSAMPIEAGLGMSLTHGGQTDLSLMYRPLRQASGLEPGDLFVAARVGRITEDRVAAMRSVLAESPSIRQVVQPVSLRAWMSGDQSIQSVRTTAYLLIGFAFVGLTLALAGVYGIVAENVKRRTSEIGIRMALGASRGHVVVVAAKDGVLVTVAGLVLGLIGILVVSQLAGAVLYGSSFEVTGLRTGLLYGVDALDATVLLVTCAVVVTVAAIGGLLPARAATNVDPAKTLRVD